MINLYEKYNKTLKVVNMTVYIKSFVLHSFKLESTAQIIY